MKLAIVIGTVREGRVTDRLARWVARTAGAQGGIEVDMIDLKQYPMPFFDEPASPRFNPHRQVHTVVQKWLSRMEAAEAYIFVTPEYNHGYPGVLKNALDYLTWEMVKKPASVVSHGAVGGARATVQLKEVLSESRCVVIPTQVAFAGGVGELIDEDGRLDSTVTAHPYGPHVKLISLLDELKWYSDTLAARREKS